MTRNEYINRKVEIEQSLKQLNNQYLSENNIKVGDIGVDLVTKEPIKVASISIRYDGCICVDHIYKQNKSGGFMNILRYNRNGVIVNGRIFRWA